MKYFKQTKETRRILSFFLSLALMISLVPASNKVAEAANGNANVNVVEGTLSHAKLGTVTANGKGSVKFTVSAEENYEFKDTNAVTVEKLAGDGTGATVVSASAVSGSGVTASVEAADVVKSLTSNNLITVTVTNIQTDIKLTVNATATQKTPDNPSTDPDNPSVDPTPVNSYKLTFSVSELKNAEAKYQLNGATPAAITADTTLTIKENDIFAIVVSPKGNGNAFKNQPTVTTTTSAEAGKPTKSGESYIYNVTGFKADTNISIKGEAVATEIVSEVAENNAVTAEAAIDPAELKDIQDKAIKELKLTDAEIASLSGENSTHYIALELAVVDVSEEDKTAVSNTVEDKKANIVNEIKKDTSVSGTNISATDIKVGTYLDITVTAKLKKRDGSGSVKEATVKDTAKELTITITVDSLVGKGISRLNDTTKVRVYYIIRMHDNEVTVIPCAYNPANDSISFDSSMFSTYVLCYADVPKKAGSTVDHDNGLANYPVSAGTSASTPTPAPTASAAPSASPSASATPTTSAAPTTEPGTGDGNTGNDNTTGGNTGNTGGNGTVNNPGGNNNTDDGDKTTTTKKKTISKLKVTAKKNAKQIKVTTIKKAKVVVTTNRKVIKSGKKSVKKITIKAANNKKGNVTVKLSKKLKKGDKITVKVSKSGYKTKTKTVKVK